MRNLERVKGVGPVTKEKLNKLGIYSVQDLMDFLPTNYVDLDAISEVAHAYDGEFVLLKLLITKASKPFRKGKLAVFIAGGTTEQGDFVKLSFYNSSFVSKNITEGKIVRCYGKLRLKNGPELINPAYELFDGINTKFTGIKPIYPTRGHIPQATFISIIGDAMTDFSADGIIPESVAQACDMLTLNEAYRIVHHPEFMFEISKAGERIVLENIVKRIAAFRLIRESGKREVFYTADLTEVKRFIASLPYDLTPSQFEAVNAICSGLCSQKPLNAMLTGDVGSGKTIVAVIATYFVAKSGKQVAIMAPTEILALQHYRTFTNLYQNFGIKVAILTGSLTASEKRSVYRAIESGDVDVVIGTHAVISKGVKFASLSMMVIDEQHRFGVAQRTALLDKGNSMDVLTLTATPIPRSLRLTMYGDMDVLSIERRHASTNIITAIVPEIKRNDMLKYIASECKNGKQAYIVCPKIVDDEGIDSGSAEALFEELKNSYGKDVKIALLHGKIAPKDKDAVLSGFASGEISILVSTTVIEVGIDVPNASLMVIFNADKFGLATLHQLRGRIGRNGAKSYCFLYYTGTEDNARLSTLVNENDGMKIAEQDYMLRGAGDWLGESQSGTSGKFSPSIALLKKARKIADGLNLDDRREELLDFAAKLALEKVSLN